MSQADAQHDQVDALDPSADDPPRALRSRRSLLAAGLGGLAGAVAAAFGRPGSADAAAGDALKLGETNYAGSAATRLNTTSSGGAFWMTQNGSGSGVRGDSPGGHGGVFTTQHVDRYGVYAQQNATTRGTGAAVRAVGGSNVGVDATTDAAPAPGSGSVTAAVSGAATSDTGAAAGVYGVSASSLGFGVYGHTTASSSGGTGVLGIADGTGGGFGGQFFGSTAIYAEADEGGIAAQLDGLLLMNGPERLVPITDPGNTPGASLYARTNGSSKVELCVVFPSGAVQVLATEP
jgi:hypothetical protein